MELKTRCPRCGTSFAASVEVLQRRRGYIRCIQCAHIFDGFEEVIDEQAPEPSY
ncbi:zinc-ribbon domain-containing protein, partial [Alcaligenes pakistanensis]